MKILSERKQDYLGFLDGDGEDDEEKKVDEYNEEWWFENGGRKLVGARVEMFVPSVLSWKDWKRMWLVDFMEILIFV